MKVSTPRLKSCGNCSRYECKVAWSGGTWTLWYEVEKSFQDYLSPLADAALLAFLVPAMCLGEDIEIEGQVSERLLWNCRETIQPLLRAAMPELTSVQIFSGDATRACRASHEVTGTGFSGGVDSFFTLHEFFFRKRDDDARIKSLLFVDTGQHGVESLLFERRLARIRDFCIGVNLPLVAVRSNIDQFYDMTTPSSWNFAQTHSMRNATVAHILGNRISRFLYSSGVNFSNVFIGRTTDTAYQDPALVPLFSSNLVEFASVGGWASRVEKTIAVSDIAAAQTFLDVCVRSDYEGEFVNCGKCKKCIKTLATLDLGGHLNEFAHVFDIQKWRKDRSRMLSIVLASDDIFFREIVDFAEARGWIFPKSSRIFSKARRAKRAVGSILR